MSQHYTILDLIQMAIQIEKDGIIFYNSLINKTSRADLKMVYLKFKEEEEKHQTTYENLYKTLSGTTQDNAEESLPAILEEFIQNTIFDTDKIDRIVDGFQSNIAALDYAIRKEKDSINFYQNMKDLFNDEDKAIIDNIINEEFAHINKLTQFKNEILKSGTING